jgi:hypothetical protein
MGRVQQAQERWRANSATYNNALTGVGSLGFTTTATSGGYYTLSLLRPATNGSNGAIAGATDANSYSVLATAGGSQTADTNCRVLKVNTVGGNLTYFAGTTNTSLADASTDGTARRCWNR